jgi:acetyl esterase
MFPDKRTSLKGFPRSLLITAEKDPLRDDGKRLAQRLKAAGVRVHHEHFDHEAHGFPCSEGPTEAHQRVMSIARDWIADISRR